MTTPDAGAILARLRTAILAILLIGLIGTGTELLLIDHDEDLLQTIPLVLIAAGLIALSWHRLSSGPASVLLLRVTMTGLLAAGGLGVTLHYRGSAEFQREVDPSIAGFDLFMKVMTSKAPPALAPGVMAQLGLLGLAYTYRNSK